jgi:uncharacterized membrane protein
MREGLLCRIGWGVMTLLALGVAAYASMALWNPEGIDFIANRDGALRVTLIVHGAVGATALAIGPFQFLEGIRNAKPWSHRLVGRVYVVCVIVSGVSGLWLAFHTPGGLPANSGFFLLAVLWLLTAGVALPAAWRRDFATHREWMMRSYALTFGAVTLRIYLGLGVAVAGLPFEQVYGMAAWASWVVNLLFVEWVLLPSAAERRGAMFAGRAGCSG